MTDLSVIICTRNRAAHLRDTLTSLAAVRVPDGLHAELLVVDNGGKDDTPAVVQNAVLPQMDVRYVYEARRGQCFARNTGLCEARGDLFLWTDDDVRPPPDWAERMTAPLLSGAAHSVTGGVRMAPHLRRLWMEPIHHMLLASTEFLTHDTVQTMIGANMAFRRDVLATVPAFDPELGPGALGFYDESLFSFQMARAGLTLAPLLDVQVEHHFDASRLTRASFLQSIRNVGWCQAYLAHHWKHGAFEDDPHAPVARPVHRPERNFVRKALDLALLRLQHWPEWHVPEGGALWELLGVQRVAFYRQFLRERTRPPNYERLGLVKRHGVLP